MDDATGRLIIKIGFGLILAFIAWTVVASFVFLFGTGLLQDFPHPFWQWWLYAMNFDRNPRVALWLKLSAAVGAAFPLLFVAAIIVRSRQVVGPRLRRPIFGGLVASPPAVTDNHGHAAWMSMEQALERFPGIDPDFGGIVVGEAYRVDQDKGACASFDSENPRTWGQGGKSRLLIDPCRGVSTHSLVITGSGGFKTATAISVLLHWIGSGVILDPGGEIAAMLRDTLIRMGHKVYEIEPSSQLGFNVLEWIDISSSEAATHISSVVTWICGESKPSINKLDDYFSDTARSIVACLIAHVLSDPELPDEMKNLRTVREAIAQPSAEIRNTLQYIYDHSTSEYARQLAGPVCGLIEDTFSGVVGNAATQTAWLGTEAFATLVSGDVPGMSFKSSEILNGKTTIFLKMPVSVLGATPGISRTIIGALMNANYQSNGNFSGRTLYLLDEAARLGYMKILEDARDTGRKHGVTLQLLYQSSGQIVDQWGEQGKRAWYDGVAFRCYAAVQDLETATELEDSFGTYGVMASSEGTNTGKSGKALAAANLSRGSNTSYHEIARPLIRRSELMHDTREDEMFVVIRSNPPLRCGRAIYFRRPEMTAKVAANRFYKKPKPVKPVKS